MLIIAILLLVYSAKNRAERAPVAVGHLLRLPLA